jgi:CrcB protein
MTKWLFIAIGGAAGAVLRYALGTTVQRLAGGVWPWGTFCVNMAGSLAIGLLAGLFEESTLSENVRILLLVGVLGAFTTFSTFSLESAELIRDRQYLPAITNMLGSCAAGLVLVFAGFFAARAALAALR